MEWGLLVGGLMALAAVATFAGLALKYQGQLAGAQVDAASSKAMAEAQRLAAGAAETARLADVARLEAVILQLHANAEAMDHALEAHPDPVAVRARLRQLLSPAPAGPGAGGPGGGAVPVPAAAGGQPGGPGGPAGLPAAVPAVPAASAGGGAGR